MAGLFVKKGDTVQVISGKDKGVTGRVISVDAERERVLVEGVNRIKKHTKISQSARGSQQGGIVTTEAPVHVSNVQIVDPSDGKPTRSASLRRRRPQGPLLQAHRQGALAMTTTDSTADTAARRAARAAAPQGALPQRDQGRADRAVHVLQPHADPRRGQGRREHGCR
jgi:large subunit ribosomal protein L24